MNFPFSPRKNQLTIVLVGIGVIFASTIQSIAWKRAIEIANNNFLSESQLIRDKLYQRLSGANDAVTDLATLVYSSLHVDADQFRIFSEIAFERDPFMVSTGYYPRIPGELRKPFERERRARGFPLFSIRDRASESSRIAEDRPFYFPLLYHEPFSPENASDIGIDALSDPAVNQSIEKAIDTALTIATFTPDASGRHSAFLLKAIYTGKSIPEEIHFRHQAASGLIILEIDTGRIFEHLTDHSRLEVTLASMTVGNWQQLAVRKSTPRQPSLQAAFLPVFSQKYTIALQGQQYLITVKGFPALEDLDHAFFIMTLLAGAVTVFVLGLAGVSMEKRTRELKSRHKEIARQVSEKTAEISAANRQLKAVIAERLRAQQSLADSEAKFRGLFDRMTSGAAIFQAVDEEGSDFRFLDLNLAAEQTEKIQREQAIGSTIGMLFPGAEASGLLPLLRKVHQTGTPQFLPEHHYVDKRISGWRENSIFKLPSGELVVLFNDISDRKRQEERLRQAQKMEAIGTLAGGIAHDFNNILTAILGFTEVARLCANDEEKVRSSLCQVIVASRRAKDLIKQILTFSRKESRRLEPLFPYHIVKESLKLIRAGLPSTIRIEEHIDRDCGMIKADPVSLQQVLMNLCTNALAAMENQEGAITVRMGLLQQFPMEGLGSGTKFKQGPCLELTVSDTGYGMDPKTLDRIFEPYFTTKELGKGTGLGLSLVHGIVEDHGGLIRVESEQGKGSTFRVYFPTVKAGEARTEQISRGSIPGGDERILLVDDEKIIVDAQKSFLEFFGYSVTAATDPVEALDIFRAAPRAFDLIITDQTMPGLPGVTLAREAIRIRSDIPIILCTGYSAVISEEEAKKIGITAFTLKPIEQEEFANLIRSILSRGKMGKREK